MAIETRPIIENDKGEKNPARTARRKARWKKEGGEDVLNRTNRTVSGLSRNNVAFNNGCLVPSGEREDRLDIWTKRTEMGKSGGTRRKVETRRSRGWKGDLEVLYPFRNYREPQHARVPYRSRWYSARVPRFSPFNVLTKLPNPSLFSRSSRRRTIFRNLRGVVLRFHAPFRPIRRSLRFSFQPTQPRGTSWIFPTVRSISAAPLRSDFYVFPRRPANETPTVLRIFSFFRSIDRWLPPFNISTVLLALERDAIVT